jgi:hypothetical protein
MKRIISIERKLEQINRQFNGDGLRVRYEGVSPISLKGRIDRINRWIMEHHFSTYKIFY